MMLILGYVRLSKGQQNLGGLVPRRVRAPQGYSLPQKLEKIFHPVGAILMEPFRDNPPFFNFHGGKNLSHQGKLQRKENHKDFTLTSSLLPPPANSFCTLQLKLKGFSDLVFITINNSYLHKPDNKNIIQLKW